MSSKDNLKGKGFGDNPQNINKNGRPKKIYTILKQMGYSKDDVKSCFGELMWYTKTQLKELIKDETKPIITTITAKALVEASDTGEFNKIKEILEQSIGKANQSIDLTEKISSKEKDIDAEDWIKFQKRKKK